MVRYAVLAFAILLGSAASRAQDLGPAPKATAPPSVTVLLPPSVPSEDIQVAYELSGPFGGYGGDGDADPEPNPRSYKIDAAINGKAAREAKLIVYAPGCDIQTFVIPLQADSAANAEFECVHVPSVGLSGQIVPTELSSNSQLEVIYEADWGNRFFGIMDGRVTQFKLASVRPDAEGRFQVDLPYFAVDSDTVESQASFSLILRDRDSGNLIAFLEPELPDFVSEGDELRIRPSYPSGLRFKATPSNVTTDSDGGIQP